MKFFMFLGFLGHTLGCLPGFSRIFTNKFKDLTKKNKNQQQNTAAMPVRYPLSRRQCENY